MNREKSEVYPILVEWAIETEGPTTVPEAIRTLEATTDSEWTIAPTSRNAVESMQADSWKVPPPFSHFLNLSLKSTKPSSELQTQYNRKEN